METENQALVFANVNEFLAAGGNTRPEAMRPYMNKKGETVICVNGQELPTVRQNTTSVLRQYEWQQIDDAVNQTVHAPNTALADFQQYGLTFPLAGGIGTLLSGYTNLGDMSAAEVNMDGVTEGDNDRPTFSDTYIPVPFVFKDFNLSGRVLAASRNNGGQSLDLTATIEATRLVRNAIEYMIFNGNGKKIKTASILGLLNAPSALSQSAATWGGGDFGTAQNGHKTVAGMLTSFYNAGFTGPFGMYVSATQYGQLLNLISTTNAQSELAVILASFPDLKFIRPKPSTIVADGTSVMFQLSRDVIDMPVAQDVTPVEWAIKGPFLTQYRVMACLTVRAKADANSVSGVKIATSC